MKPQRLCHLATVALISSVSAQAPQAAPAFEQGMQFHAPDLFPAEKLQGPAYRVRDQVITDGFMAHFQIDSDFGTFEATGVPQAKQRIVEIEAIRADMAEDMSSGHSGFFQSFY